MRIHDARRYIQASEEVSAKIPLSAQACPRWHEEIPLNGETQKKIDSSRKAREETTQRRVHDHISQRQAKTRETAGDD